MEVTLRIKRFNPETDKKAHFEEYVVDVEPRDRVLDALNQVKWYQDGTLTYRRSCGHGICGSDAMRINGRNRLACKVLMQDVGKRVTLEPLMAFKVEKDLLVNMDQFWDNYKSVKPYLIPGEKATPHEERRQSIAQQHAIDDTSKCILCASCTTSCPVTWMSEDFIGPAAIVNAHRFIFDSRDAGGTERLKILNKGTGVWRCRTVFNCTDACPRDIKVTEAIEQVKRALIFGDA